MESFASPAIILSLRAYMDKGVVVSAFTRGQGRHAGFAYKSQLAGVEIGTLADVTWQARVADQLGTFKAIDIEQSYAPRVIGHRRKLMVLQSLCGILDVCLPEREAHPDLFEATIAMLDALTTLDDELVVGASYVMWELMVLRALGYGLDLSKCNATDGTENLIYVSPKTGKAVCADAGAPYKDRMLSLPPFLRPDGKGEELTDDHVRAGLKLTQTFFEKWVLTHMSAELPALRYSLFKN